MDYIEYRYLQILRACLEQEKEILFLLSASRKSVADIVELANKNPESDFAKNVHVLIEKGV